MDVTLREGYSITFCMELIAMISHDYYYNSFVAFFVNWYSDILFPEIGKLFLISIRINEFMDVGP
jgi:hypothetical protein